MTYQLKFLLKWVVFLGFISQSGPSYAQLLCQEVFPGAVSSAQNSSVVRLYWLSRIINTPGNLLHTTNLQDSTWFVDSCYSGPCVATNTLATDNNGTFNQFSGGADVSLGNSQTRILQPGAYDDLSLGSGATLIMQPGIYTFRGSISTGTGSSIQLEGPGGTAVFVRDSVSFGNQAEVNTAGSQSTLFFFVRGNVNLGPSAAVQGFIYARGSVALQNQSFLRGAITARGDITLGTSFGFISGATVEYDAGAMAGGEFGNFCSAGAAISVAEFLIETPLNGSTCQPAVITVSALDASGDVLTGYTGSISLSTSTGRGDWSKTAVGSDALGVLAPGSANSGLASYAFETGGNDAGTVTLQVASGHAGPLSVTVSDVGAGVTTTSAPIAFADNAFVVTATDDLGQDVVVGRNHSLQVQMVRRDPTSGVCGIATNYNRATLRAWITRATSDPGGIAPNLINSASASTTLPEVMPASDNVAANFAGGTANLLLAASDVGRYGLHFADYSGTFAGTPIQGSGSVVTARPFALHVQVPNPGAINAGGAAFQAAGQSFGVSVRAVGWQSVDDVNGDGIADGHGDDDPSNNADLADNAVAPSFGLENPGESVVLQSTLIQPSGGTDPGLSSSLAPPADGRTINGFVSGSGSTSNVNFNEVGIIEVRADVEDGNYLGAPAFTGRIAGRSGHVGRFIPGHLSLTAPSVVESCEVAVDYSYMAEPFHIQYTLSALSTRGSITRNYHGEFAKLSDSIGTVDMLGRDLFTGTDLQTRLAEHSRSVPWVNGTASAEGTILFGRAATPDGPYRQLQLGALPIDQDAVTVAAAARNFDTDADGNYESVLLGETEVRFGRLLLEDAFGPETSRLPVAMKAEYWDGDTWRTNHDDSCTRLTLDSIQYPAGPISMAANRNVTVGGGSARGEYANITAADVGFNDGDAGHYFTAPGAGNTGSFMVDVSLLSYPWLRFDWNGDGDHSDLGLPSANYTFGVYRGHDRVIYWREVLR